GIAGQSVTFKASSGGRGGDIAIAAVTAIDLTGAVLMAGHGGRGGRAYLPDHPWMMDGVGRGQPGQDLISSSGDGGEGGSILLNAPTNLNPSGNGGLGGEPGDVTGSP